MLTRSDSYHFLHRRDKHFAVTQSARTGRRNNGVYDIMKLSVGHDYLKLQLWQKFYLIFRPTIQFLMPFLAAKTLHLHYGETFDASVRKGFFHFFELEWLDDRLDFFHFFTS